MIKIYCDGATSSNGKENALGGYGGIIIKEEKEYPFYGKVTGKATNQVCEIWAAIVSMSTTLANFSFRELENETIEIYSDSAYVVNCINDGWYKNWQNNGWLNSQKNPVANQELWEKLISYLPLANFTFM